MRVRLPRGWKMRGPRLVVRQQTTTDFLAIGKVNGSERDKVKCLNKSTRAKVSERVNRQGASRNEQVCNSTDRD